MAGVKQIRCSGQIEWVLYMHLKPMILKCMGIFAFQFKLTLYCLNFACVALDNSEFTITVTIKWIGSDDDLRMQIALYAIQHTSPSQGPGAATRSQVCVELHVIL